MKRCYLFVCLLVMAGQAYCQHDLNWMIGIDYGVPVNSFAQNRSVLSGTIPSHQFNINTSFQYRAFNRIGLEFGVGQAIRTMRAVDRRLADESPDYKSVMHVKNHYLMAHGGLQLYLPMPEGDFFVFSGGYCWNYAGGKSQSATETFVHADEDIVVTTYYKGSNNSIYGEIGYNSPSEARMALYIGLKANVGTRPIMKGDYTVTSQAQDASYSDHFEDKTTYIGMNIKYYLNVLHKDKAERRPKKDKQDKQPVEVKHILKDTMVIEGRPVIVGKSILAFNPDITISLWDAEAIDGDTVSLILNGEYILRNQALTADKIDVKAKLQQGKNYLVLYAHNQGKYPPNTAAIIVDDGERKNQIELKSNLKSNGAIEITLGK
jgi:hypothetical protein